MSFLSGILNFGKTAVGLLSGNSIFSTLARTAVLGYAVNRLSKSANKGQNSGTNNIDEGVRLQVKPNADSKIPVLYGSAFFGGNIIDAAMVNNNKTMWFALALTEKTGNLYSTSSATTYLLNNVYLNDQRVQFQGDGITVDYTQDRGGTIDRNASGLIQIYFYAGGRTAGQKPVGFAGAVPNSEAVFPNWTAGTHALTNVVFALVKVDYNRDKGVTGLPDVKFNIASSMFTPGDVIYDYLTNTTYGAGISAGEILTTDITALNTYSLASVAYADQGTGAQTLGDRYQINGLIDTANSVLDNAESILNATASFLSYDTHEGKWGVIINKADTSVAAFDDTNIIDNISVSGTGLQDLYNAVKVQFPHRELRDSADFYNISVPTSAIPADWSPFSLNSNEEPKTLNITYDIVNEPIQAQMLGLIELKQSRIDKVIQFKTDWTYYNLKAGDVIDVTNSRFGFTAKLFRIIAVKEQQDNDGALVMDITALEYNVNVYSVVDLFRFTRSDANGIITFGSIGTPGTPTVSKVEIDSRPRVQISTTAPTGIVEAIEFWLSNDVALAEANRSYRVISVERPVGGGVYSSGTAVTFEYDSVSSSDFVVKTRGTNTATTGPFSAVSGLVNFVPRQTTQAIDPSTSIFNSAGGLLGALSLVSMLTKVSDLFGSGDTGKSLFTRIFETFQSTTGLDILGQASGGSLVVASNLTVKADTVTLTAGATSVDFKTPLIATGGPAIEVKIKPGTANKDILAWNTATSKWETISGCIDCEFPVAPVVPVVVPCSLVVASTLPANNYSIGSTVCPTDVNPDVPATGSYFITWSIDAGTGPAKNINTATLVKGTGSFKLYTTNGDLIQTLPVANTIVHGNVLELPFVSRKPGTDYYVIWTAGVLTSCTCENLAVTNATTWTFTTSSKTVSPYALPANTTIGSSSANDSRTVDNRGRIEFTPTPISSICTASQNLILTFGRKVKKGSGSIVISDAETGTAVLSLSVSASTITNTAGVTHTVNFGAITGLSDNKVYNLSAPVGLLISDTPATSTAVCDTITNIPAVPDQASVAKTWSIRTKVPLTLVKFEVCEEPSGNARPRTNIKLFFNKDISIKATSPAYVYIKSTGIFGSTHQRIDLRGTFATNQYGNFFSVSGKVLTINPTEQLKSDTQYYINIDSGTLLDTECNVIYAGISDQTTVVWTTDGAKSTPPTQPLTYGSIKLDLNWDRKIIAGPGKMNILTPAGQLLTQVSANDGYVVKFSNSPF